MEDLNRTSWEDIEKLSKFGEFVGSIGLGSVKPLYNRQGKKIAEMQLVDTNADELAPFSYRSKTMVSTTWIASFSTILNCMCEKESQLADNISGTHPFVGWINSSLREYLNNYLFWQLPDDLRSIIKPVKKLTHVGTKAGAVTTDTIWIPSAEELGESGYSLFRRVSDSIILNKRVCQDRTGANKIMGTSYWLRNSIVSVNRMSHSEEEHFYMIQGTGIKTTYDPVKPLIVNFGFCI